MFIENSKWENLKTAFKMLYKELDNFSDDIKNKINNVDECINILENSSSNKIYVITNNSIVDDEVYYNIYGVTSNKKEAKKLLKEAIKNVKQDSDFYNLDAININKTNSLSVLDEKWFYSEDENSFSLFLNGNYNSNNYSIYIKEYSLDKNKDKIKNIEISM